MFDPYHGDLKAAFKARFKHDSVRSYPVEVKQIGWLCPRCGTVNSPVMKQCACKPNQSKIYKTPKENRPDPPGPTEL